jgi:hypothetical protein
MSLCATRGRTHEHDYRASHYLSCNRAGAVSDQYAADRRPGETAKQIARVIVVVIGVVSLLRYLTVF